MMRKQRTRQHIIEDLGFNHIERHILKAGYTVHRYARNDYGLDGEIHTFTDEGETEPINIQFQLKSTDKMSISSDGASIKFDLPKRDIESWLLSFYPVLLVVYDAQKEMSYFVDLQDYFKTNRIQLNSVKKYIRILLPIKAIFSTTTVRHLRFSLFQ